MASNLNFTTRESQAQAGEEEDGVSTPCREASNATPPPHTQYGTAVPASPAFPTRFNVYSPPDGSNTSCILGEHRDQPLCGLNWHSKPCINRSVITLFDGLCPQDAILASSEYEDWRRSHWRIDLPQRTALATMTIERVVTVKDWKRCVFGFSIETDAAGGTREDFEWRSSNNENIRNILDGYTLGWKLVRMTEDALGNEVRGTASRGGWPRTSDHKEIIAVCSRSRHTMTKLWRVAFLGIGASGALGKRWVVMAVVTSLTLMDWDYKRAREIT